MKAVETMPGLIADRWEPRPGGSSCDRRGCHEPAVALLCIGGFKLLSCENDLPTETVPKKRRAYEVMVRYEVEAASEEEACENALSGVLLESAAKPLNRDGEAR